jgi:hypothetical protein
MTMHNQQRDDRDYRVRKLSESVDGRGISVAATSSPGTLIHTAVESQAANEFDAITLRAVNTTGSPIKLTVEWGGVNTADQIEITIPGESGFTEVIPGHVLQDGAEVRAFAATTNGLVLHGIVHRYGNSRK